MEGKKFLFSEISEESTKEVEEVEQLQLFTELPEESVQAEKPLLFSVIPEEQKSENIEEKARKKETFEVIPNGNGLSMENIEKGQNKRIITVFSRKNRLPANGTKCLQTVQQEPNQTLRSDEKRGFDFQSIRFSYSEGSLYAHGKGGNSKYLGNFCLTLIEEIRTKEEVLNEANEFITNITTTSWKFQIILSHGKYIACVRETDLLNLLWIREASYFRAAYEDTAESKRILKMYVQKIISSEQHDVITEFTAPGWKFKQDNTAYYVTSDGVVGFPNLPVRAVKGYSLLTSGRADQQGIIREFFNMRRIIPDNIGNAVFLQHYVIASLMTSFFKKSGFQVEFTVALIGKTNTKKTSCGEIFARIFERTKGAVPDINFSATEAAIYEIMGKGADQIVMVDDLTPSENDGDAKMKRRKVEQIIRSYGDRVPRRRSISFASNQNATEFVPITGCALLTGEEFSFGKSSRARVVLLKFEEGDVDDEVLTYFQDNLYILPDFVNVLIPYLGAHIVSVMNIIPQECAYARNCLKNKIKTPRYRDVYGIVCATSRILNNFLKDIGFMSYEEAETMLMNDREFMLQIIMQNDSEVSMIAPGITVVEALGDAIDKKVVEFKSLNQWRKENYKNKVFVDDTYIYVQLETLFECAKKYTDYRKIPFPYTNGKAIAELLNAESLILLKREGNEIRKTHKLVIDGKLVNTRYVYLLRAKIEEIWKKGEEI